MYRTEKSGGGASSDDSSDEDTPLWRQKQEKYFRKQKGAEIRSSPDANMDVRPTPAPERKKSNNIWGSVLTEQDLTQTMVRSAAVDRADEFSFNERNVESYDFTKKYLDSRPDLDEQDSSEHKSEMRDTPVPVRGMTLPGRSIIDYEDTVDKYRDKGRNRQNRKRKADSSHDRDQRSSVHDRLGVKKLTTTQLGNIDISVDMEVSELIQKIADFLHEPKVEIIERIVAHLGKEFAVRLVQSTKEVEDSGGMYTLDGSRRRTPGGVYLTLLKQQPEWNKEARKQIFIEDVQEQLKHKREKRKIARRQKKRNQKGDKQNDKESRSRSNSKSRSRSNSSSKSINRTKDENEEAMEDGEIREEDETKNKRDNSSRRSRRDEESSEESEDEEENRGKSNWAKPFDFEEELARAKKLILEKSEGKKERGDGMETGQELADLDTAEANVVDIEIGIDDTG